MIKTIKTMLKMSLVIVSFFMFLTLCTQAEKIEILEAENFYLSSQIESLTAKNNNISTLSISLEKCYKDTNNLLDQLKKNSYFLKEADKEILKGEVLGREARKKVIDILNSDLPTF